MNVSSDHRGPETKAIGVQEQRISTGSPPFLLLWASTCRVDSPMAEFAEYTGGPAQISPCHPHGQAVQGLRAQLVGYIDHQEIEDWKGEWTGARMEW